MTPGSHLFARHAAAWNRSRESAAAGAPLCRSSSDSTDMRAQWNQALGKRLKVIDGLITGAVKRRRGAFVIRCESWAEDLLQGIRTEYPLLRSLSPITMPACANENRVDTQSEILEPFDVLARFIGSPPASVRQAVSSACLRRTTGSMSRNEL